MAAHVQVTLDTTAPALEVEAAADVGDSSLITLTCSTDDAVELLVWGDIDPTDPLNDSYGETEGAADWIEFAGTLQVRVTPAAATLRVRARDDVWNETDPVVLSLSPVTPPVPTPAAPRRGGLPERAKPKPAARIVSFPPSVLAVKTSYRARANRPSLSLVAIEGQAMLRVGQTTRTIIRAEESASVAAQVAGREEVGLEETAVIHRADGPDETAALSALDIL